MLQQIAYIATARPIAAEGGCLICALPEDAGHAAAVKIFLLAATLFWGTVVRAERTAERLRSRDMNTAREHLYHIF